MSNNATNSGHISRKASCPAQNMDFVSADVNEVLQDAREILTNKEHREIHPNERILDESTSVKFTKTGGDGDPMEITVLRQRTLKRDEEDAETFTAHDDRGWSSDTDLVSPSQRNRLPSLHKCSHNNKKVQSSGNLPEEMTNERHMNVIYRRRHKEDLWQRDDLASTGKEISAEIVSDAGTRGNEDDAQLKVEITEHCRTETSGAHLIKQTWEATWSVQTFHSLPDWLQDNDFLHTGHRPPLPSFAACFKSIWSLHTETGNIWTHLIGCLAFFFLALWFVTRPETHIQFQEKVVFSFFFAGAILCLGLSFTFHTVSCHSKYVVRIFSRLDYMGISLLIVGSFIPWIYYGFYCRREPKISYISMIGVLGLSAVVVSLWDKFNDKKYRPMRAAIFSFMGCSGVVPTLHFAYTDGMTRLIEDNSFYWLIAMAILYLSGVTLYATRTPERFFPGKCDLLFQSHQLFHLCVVCGAFAHYYGIFNMAMKRLTGTCPGHHDTVVIQHNEL